MRFKGRRLLLAIGLAMLGTIGAVAAPAGGVAWAGSDDCSGSLGPAGQYSEWVAGSVTRGIGTVAGPVAYGGSATFGQFSPSVSGPTIAAGEPVSPSPLYLIVGGSLVVNGPSTLESGRGTVGGSFLQNAPFTVDGGGTVTQFTAPPFNFATVGSGLKSASTGWAAAGATGSVSGTSTLTLTGTDPTQDIFSVTEAQLAAATHIVINVPSASPQPTILINVSGASAYANPTGQTISYTNGGTAQAATTLWNFNGATSISLSGITWYGTVVAPSVSTLNASNGSILGSLIVGGSGGGGSFTTKVNSSTNTWNTGTTNGSGLNLFTGTCLPSNSGPSAELPEGHPIELGAGAVAVLGAGAYMVRRRYRADPVAPAA